LHASQRTLRESIKHRGGFTGKHGRSIMIWLSSLVPLPISYMKEFDVLYRVLIQKRDDTGKVYSVLEPEVLCISKGKEHKPYEFGNKNSFAYTRKSGIIVEAMAVEENTYSGRLAPR
jgi:hypothetical protein